jgi:hypothetical protein
MPTQGFGFQRFRFSKGILVKGFRIFPGVRLLWFFCSGFLIVVHGDWDVKIKSNILNQQPIAFSVSKSTYNFSNPWFSSEYFLNEVIIRKTTFL